jgi:glycosyltransferase involved in cell wall biosynthesis
MIAAPERVVQLRQAFPRVAIAHDWLTIPGGSEKVLLALLGLFPEAEVFTTVLDPRPWPPALLERPIHTSFLNRLPGATHHYPKLLPLMTSAFRSFDLTDFDLVISSSHSCAKNVKPPDGVPYVCYCHTPLRHIWDSRFLQRESLGRIGRGTEKLVRRRLVKTDLAGAERPDVIVANSENVKERIKTFWGRDAVVVYPPVDVERFLAMPRRPDDYYLVLGRVVPYKRVDLAVSACARLGRRVKVAGDGRALEQAREAAGPDAEFLGYVPDERLTGLLAGARALICCAEEDFGIVAAEAQAAGVPLIAYGIGGMAEIAVDGETGVLFDAQTVDSVCDAILRFEAMDFHQETIRENALRFADSRFRDEMVNVLLALSS